MNADDAIRDLGELNETGDVMPALFIGHGSPTNAIEDNEFTRAWTEIALSLPRPKAILCVSAHWETVGTQVTAMEQPRTIYDFYGFPQQLYDAKYSAPGSPDLARLTRETETTTPVELDYDWGLDHGAWSVLCRMYPKASVPVVQLSLDRSKGTAFHYELAKDLKKLRKKGVLILGSGNIVHNLGRLVWQDAAYDWAVEFDESVKDAVVRGDHASVVEYHKLGPAASLSVPTNEHYLPLLYALAVQERDERVSFFAERVTLGAISMRSVRIG